MSITALIPIVGKVLDRIIPDPAARDEAKFKMAELAQKGEFHDLEEFKVEVQDRMSARDMAKTVGIETQQNLSYGICAIWAAAQGLVLFGYGKDLDPVILSRILGQLDAAMLLALYFWFGSSSGSKNKDLK